MRVKVTFPEEALPARLTLNPELRMDDDEYYAFCVANPDVRFERTSEGEIVIVPPAGYESDDRNAEVMTQLRIWAKRHGRGRASGSSTEFILPTGAALSPDASLQAKACVTESPTPPFVGSRNQASENKRFYLLVFAPRNVP